MQLSTVGVRLILPVFVCANAFAQTPSVVIVNFERAVFECADGKKASQEFDTKLKERQGAVQKKQKELEDAENKLRTQEKALSDTARLELTRSIEQRRIELDRLNEDSEKEFGALRQQLLAPVAERVQQALNLLARDMQVTLIVDVSNPQSGVVWASAAADVTDNLIKRVDAEKPAPKP